MVSFVADVSPKARSLGRLILFLRLSFSFHVLEGSLEFGVEIFGLCQCSILSDALGIIKQPFPFIELAYVAYVA